MTAYRLRARLLFVPGNGLAAWARDQNAVRLGMAYHLNEGRADEERSRQAATEDVYTCDLIFPSDALAQDTWATLIAVCTVSNLRPVTDGRDHSWMDLHACGHAGTPTPCTAPTQTWNNRPPPAPAVAPWVQPTGAQDAYPVDALVTYGGQTWRSTTPANVWQPGVFGWVLA